MVIWFITTVSVQCIGKQSFQQIILIQLLNMRSKLNCNHFFTLDAKSNFRWIIYKFKQKDKIIWHLEEAQE